MCCEFRHSLLSNGKRGKLIIFIFLHSSSNQSSVNQKKKKKIHPKRPWVLTFEKFFISYFMSWLRSTIQFKGGFSFLSNSSSLHFSYRQSNGDYLCFSPKNFKCILTHNFAFIPVGSRLPEVSAMTLLGLEFHWPFVNLRGLKCRVAWLVERCVDLLPCT